MTKLQMYKNILSSIDNKEYLKRKGYTNRDIGSVIQGICLELGLIEPGIDFKTKQIEYIEVGWFGKERKKKRFQDYHEYMAEILSNYVKQLENNK